VALDLRKMRSPWGDLDAGLRSLEFAPLGTDDKWETMIDKPRGSYERSKRVTFEIKPAVRDVVSIEQLVDCFRT